LHFNVLLIITTDCKDYLTYLFIANFNVITQQDTQRKLPDDDVYTSKHVTAVECINPLTPNGHYSGRTAPLNSRRCILNIYSTNIRTEYFKHAA
jgi:hypothetical protein